MTAPDIAEQAHAASDLGEAPLWAVFRRSLLRHQEDVALLWGEESWTYATLASGVVARAETLADAGVGTGSRVVVLQDNGPGFCVTDLALLALGAVKVPVSTMLSEAELATIVAQVRPKCITVGPGLQGRTTACGRVQTVIVDDVALRPDPANSLESRLATLPGAPADAPAAIYFSGGTTGAPKGIVHSQKGLLANMRSHVIEAQISANDTLLLTTPQAHAAGIFSLVAILCGATVRIEPGFDVDTFRSRVDSDGTTWTFMVPTMINRVVTAAEQDGWRPTSLRTLQYGAAPVSADVLRRAIDRFGPILQQLYGQTECPNYASVLNKSDHVAALTRPELLRSAGRAALMCELSVRDESGNPVPVDTPGEVCLQSPYTMTDYWEDSDGYAERFHGSWLRTGDIGYLDKAGYLFLVDRRNDMIISGGMNVHSIEVENAVLLTEGVLAAAVIGIPHDDWGEAVHAVVVAEADGPSRQALVQVVRTQCREALATYKRPKTIEVVDELPLTRYGKVDKKALRARYWDEAARGIN